MGCFDAPYLPTCGIGLGPLTDTVSPAWMYVVYLVCGGSGWAGFSKKCPLVLQIFKLKQRVKPN